MRVRPARVAARALVRPMQANAAVPRVASDESSAHQALMADGEAKVMTLAAAAAAAAPGGSDVAGTVSYVFSRVTAKQPRSASPRCSSARARTLAGYNTRLGEPGELSEGAGSSAAVRRQ